MRDLTVKYYGKYRAIVADNNDSLKIGRLKLKIPSILGDPEGKMGGTYSNWAEGCFVSGGHSDYGIFVVPEIGSTVWVEFEGGLVEKPIWTGVFYCNPIVNEESVSDIPEDVKEYYPNKWVLKTWNGHTIEMNDEPENECLKIIDRSGQIIKMVCHMPATSRRGIKNVDGTEKFSNSDMKDGEAYIEITDLSGQKIRLDSKEKKVILDLEETNGDVEINCGEGDTKVNCNNSEIIATGNVQLGNSPVSGVLTKATMPVCLVTGAPLICSQTVKAKV